MALYMIIECDGYDECPGHQVLWAKDCGLEEARQAYWSQSWVRKWVEDHPVDYAAFWEMMASERRTPDDTAIAHVYGTSLHKAP